ncbi:hypothetical protein NL676_036282 [Syzygium grande]|nr:hypothetical protein NL676_036282 [Syzygium grande]
MQRFSMKPEMGGSVEEESGGVKGCEDEILRDSVAGVRARSVGCGDIKTEGSLEFVDSLTPKVEDSLGCGLKREGIKT